VVVQLGGQTPLRIAGELHDLGVQILGNGTEAIDLCEDRERFQRLLEELEIRQPEGVLADNLEQAKGLAQQIGYPVLLRPSYVLGGRAMAIVHDEDSLNRFAQEALEVSDQGRLLIDKFLDNAVEADVDCLGDGENVVIAGILQHIEEAGVHSGDSACVIPPYKLETRHLDTIRTITVKLGKALKLVGLMNVQFAIQGDVVYVLEVNPRASRTAPFLAKATRRPLARMATHLLLGKTLAEVGMTSEPVVDGVFVKEAMIPFRKFPGCDALLGPEMRSTGEVMGQGKNFGNAFSKSQVAAGCPLPETGSILFTVNDFDKPTLLSAAKTLQGMGFKLFGTAGTARYFSEAGLEIESVPHLASGSDRLLRLILNGEVDLVVNTPLVGPSYEAGGIIRRAATEKGIPLITNTAAAHAAVEGIKALRTGDYSVRAVQDWGNPVLCSAKA